MPHAPYGAGLARCELFEQGGVLLAQTPVNRRGGRTVHVLSLDQRYELATLMLSADYEPTAILWRTTKGDDITPPTLDAVIAAVHTTFGANPRYRTGAP